MLFIFCSMAFIWFIPILYKKKNVTCKYKQYIYIPIEFVKSTIIHILIYDTFLEIF